MLLLREKKLIGTIITQLISSYDNTTNPLNNLFRILNNLYQFCLDLRLIVKVIVDVRLPGLEETDKTSSVYSLNPLCDLILKIDQIIMERHYMF